MNLFVYGTLRNHRPGQPHRMAKLLAEGADFIGHGRVRGILYDLGDYPGLVPIGRGAELVRGEMYAVHDEDLWYRLDDYEGDQYERCEMSVHLSNGAIEPAQVYVLRDEPDGAVPIPSGDYFKR